MLFLLIYPQTPPPPSPITLEYTCSTVLYSCFLARCSSSVGCECPQPLASYPAPAWWNPPAGGRADPWLVGQYPVDGSTQEETHDRGQPDQKEVCHQTHRSQGTGNMNCHGLSDCFSVSGQDPKLSWVTGSLKWVPIPIHLFWRSWWLQCLKDFWPDIF